MAMNNRLLRPRSTIHPEAADWANRVRSNGGSVSGTTLSAVSKFCASIASAGIRDRFYRLNLFCGTGLSACLVPLYRGPSLGGTQYGGTTDTNNNFVSGDYVETGSTGGLQGDGSTKYLNTGLAMNFTPVQNLHVSAYASNFTSNNAGLVSADTNGDGTSPRFYQGLISFNATPRAKVFYNIAENFVQPQYDATVTGFFLGSGSASGNTLYVDAISRATDAASGSTANTNTYPFFVFASNNRNVNVQNRANCRISAYSAGLHLTAAQASSFNTSLVAFRAAIGRTG
jgi:hypothetical protein